MMKRMAFTLALIQGSRAGGPDLAGVPHGQAIDTYGDGAGSWGRPLVRTAIRGEVREYYTLLSRSNAAQALSQAKVSSHVHSYNDQSVHMMLPFVLCGFSIYMVHLSG